MSAALDGDARRSAQAREVEPQSPERAADDGAGEPDPLDDLRGHLREGYEAVRRCLWLAKERAVLRCLRLLFMLGAMALGLVLCGAILVIGAYDLATGLIGGVERLTGSPWTAQLIVGAVLLAGPCAGWALCWQQTTRARELAVRRRYENGKKGEP